MSAATIRSLRDILPTATREARYRPHAAEAADYIQRAKRLHRQLLQLQAGAR